MRDIESVDADLLDPEAWEEPQRSAKSERRQRGVVVSVRLSPDEFARLQGLADEAGVAVSTLLRERALTARPGSGYDVEISAQAGTSYNFTWTPAAPSVRT